MNSTNRQIQEAMEEYIDKHGVTALLDQLAEVFSGKADHLRTNWQDEATAKLWDRAWKKLDSFTKSMEFPL